MSETDERLAEIHRRADAATEGPWFHWLSMSYGWTIQTARGWLFQHSDKGTAADAEFIAHARADVPWLLAEFAALREAYATLTAERDQLQQQVETLQAEKGKAILWASFPTRPSASRWSLSAGRRNISSRRGGAAPSADQPRRPINACWRFLRPRRRRTLMPSSVRRAGRPIGATGVMSTMFTRCESESRQIMTARRSYCAGRALQKSRPCLTTGCLG